MINISEEIKFIMRPFFTPVSDTVPCKKMDNFRIHNKGEVDLEAFLRVKNNSI